MGAIGWSSSVPRYAGAVDAAGRTLVRPFWIHLHTLRPSGGFWARRGRPLSRGRRRGRPSGIRYLVDSASSHMLVSKIKPCMSKYKQLYGETANGSLNQLSFI